MTLDENRKCFLLDADRSTFESAPGFDKNHWPDTADAKWGAERQTSAASAESGQPAKQYSRDLKKFAESGQAEPKAREAERGLDSAEGGRS